MYKTKLPPQAPNAPLMRLVSKKFIPDTGQIAFLLPPNIKGEYLLTTTNVLNQFPKSTYILYHMPTKSAQVVESDTYSTLVVWYAIRQITDAEILPKLTAAIGEHLKQLGD